MRSRRLLGLLLGCTLTLAIASAESSAQQKAAKANKAATSAAAKEETGSAVFYSDKLVGRPLTSGEKYDKNALTAAHRTLPWAQWSK
jgi:rare lipoprotein A